jgi:hypothetical protein
MTEPRVYEIEAGSRCLRVTQPSQVIVALDDATHSNSRRRAHAFRDSELPLQS